MPYGAYKCARRKYSFRQMSMPKPVGPNMATATPLGPPEPQTAQKQYAGSLERGRAAICRQNQSPGGAARKVSAPVRPACIPDTSAASGPRSGNLEGPRSPATEQPGIRGLRTGLPAPRWRLRNACGLSRLNDCPGAGVTVGGSRRNPRRTGYGSA